MKLSRFLIITIFITILAILYVHQQAEIIKMAYEGQERSKVYRELLDRSHILMYNLAILKSAQNLGQKVFIDNSEFQMPEAKQVVELKYLALNNTNSTGKARKGILSRLLDLGLRAEAKPIK